MMWSGDMCYHLVRRMEAMAKALPERKIATDELGYIGDMLRWGASVGKICDTLGMTESQFGEQMARDAELRKVVQEAKLMRDMDIQRAFFQSAVGGFRTTTSKKYVQKEDGSKQMEVLEKTEYVRADPKMMALMLKNIDPWFSEKDDFEKRLALESQLIRKQLAGKNDWKPVGKDRLVSTKATRLRGTVKPVEGIIEETHEKGSKNARKG